MIIKETLYELLKINPNFKDTLRVIINQFTKQQIKLLKIYEHGEKYDFSFYMKIFYKHMYPKYSLKETKKLSLLIINNNPILKKNKKFNILELKNFVEEFKDLFFEQKPFSIWRKIGEKLWDNISMAIIALITRLFFKKPKQELIQNKKIN